MNNYSRLSSVIEYMNVEFRFSLVDMLSDLQRAMDLYKKQRVEVVGLRSVSGVTLDIISASNQEKGEEQAPICDVVKAEEPVPNLAAAMQSVPLPTVDQKKVEAVSAAVMKENMEESFLTPTQEVQNHVSTPSVKMELLGQVYGGENPGKPLPISSEEKKAVMASEEVNVEVADGDCALTVDNESQMTMDGDINRLGKSNGSNCANCVEERLLGDAINGPKCFPGGSPRAYEAVVPGSNESESVILSRIHHSPESTH